jgi:prefoldin subunit 2
MSQQVLTPQITAKYRELTQEAQQLLAKVTELEIDRNEHKLVEETLEPLDGDRRAFRLVGGVLVERTVAEVLPSVKSNRENLDKVITSLNERLETKNKEIGEMKANYGITEQR